MHFKIFKTGEFPIKERNVEIRRCPIRTQEPWIEGGNHPKPRCEAPRSLAGKAAAPLPGNASPQGLATRPRDSPPIAATSIPSRNPISSSFGRTGKSLILSTLALLLAALAFPKLCRAQDADLQPPEPALRSSPPADFNDDIYYRNKLEFSLESGVLPINIPFVFDVFVGDDYSQKPLHYTLVPVFPSLRWHMGALHGPSILRGNTDLTLTLSMTAIPRGPETRYGAFDLGVRRNFVHRNWRAAPYFEVRGGAGYIDAQGPHGVRYAQGQDFTFTLMVGSGVRYNLSPAFSASLGISYMHVSNAYMSLPKYDDNGINVYGPMAGINVRLGKPKRASLR